MAYNKPTGSILGEKGMKSRELECLSIILPAYNEADNLKLLIPSLVSLASGYPDYEILVVDDGSMDDTVSVLKSLHDDNPKVGYICLTRNFGHQSALRAGLDHVRGNCVVSLDADFQHPPELIPEMIARWREGYDVVSTVREEDPSLPRTKRFSSKAYYALLNTLSDLSLEAGSADFRLLDRTVVQALRHLSEPNLFLRGMINWIGYSRCSIQYKPAARKKGKTNYNFKKMMTLGIQGVMSFSIQPLRLAIYMGFLISVLATAYAVYALSVHFFTEQTVPGWTSVIISVLFCGGVQMLLLGIIGEYVGKLFMESKRRPDYMIRETTLEIPEVNPVCIDTRSR